MQHLHKCPNTQNDTQTKERRTQKIKNIQRNYSETCCWQHRSCTESTIQHANLFDPILDTHSFTLYLSHFLSFSFNMKDHRSLHALTPNNVQHHSQRYARTIWNNNPIVNKWCSSHLLNSWSLVMVIQVLYM